MEATSKPATTENPQKETFLDMLNEASRFPLPSDVDVQRIIDMKKAMHEFAIAHMSEIDQLIKCYNFKEILSYMKHRPHLFNEGTSHGILIRCQCLLGEKTPENERLLENAARIFVLFGLMELMLLKERANVDRPMILKEIIKHIKSRKDGWYEMFHDSVHQTKLDMKNYVRILESTETDIESAVDVMEKSLKWMHKLISKD